MSNGPVFGGLVSAVTIILLVYFMFSFNNAVDQSPAYQNLQPSQQSILQTLQTYGGQTLTSFDPTFLEVLLGILAALGVGIPVIAKLKSG